MSNCHRFKRIATELTRLHTEREAAMLEAFAQVEADDPALASLVLQRIGERSKAARWMSMHQRAFGGLSAYELLADGDADAIWDVLSGQRQPEGQALMPGAAY